MSSPQDPVAAAVQRVAAAGLLDDASPAALFYDEGALTDRLRAARIAFPGALHAVAVKACPLPALLRIALDLGFGVEVASEGEIAIARWLGVPGDRVVFDSPAKTRREIALALARGYRVNIDNLQELDRVAEAMAADPAPRPASIGLRVNPMLEGARIAATFTGGPGSKFGIDLDASRGAILAAFAAHPWLDGLHVHVGSQGASPALLVRGVSRVLELAADIEAQGRAIRVLDIGGGLPVRYRAGEQAPHSGAALHSAPTFEEYAGALREQAPDLFRRSWQVVTEFGRAIFAPCAFAASRVEYTRPGGIAVIHFGADLFVRPAYRPEDWSHEIEVYDPKGRPKSSPLSEWSVAGPLCFSGDFIARGRLLPRIDPGDLVVIRDAGAYTLAMWSRYNSRPAPAVYGFDEGGFRLLKPRESAEDILRFWTGESGEKG